MGYFTIGLFYAPKKGITTYVHRLVAQHFIPNPELKPQVNHKNTNKLDNNVNNLEWATRSENIQHALGEGLFNPIKGESHHKTSLKASEVIDMRAFHKNGYTQKWISEKFNINRNTLKGILNRSNWKHI